MKGFHKGDPRAVAAGRKGGRVKRRKALTPDYLRGYNNGWIAGVRREQQRRLEADAEAAK